MANLKHLPLNMWIFLSHSSEAPNSLQAAYRQTLALNPLFHIKLWEMGTLNFGIIMPNLNLLLDQTLTDCFPFCSYSQNTIVLNRKIPIIIPANSLGIIGLCLVIFVCSPKESSQYLNKTDICTSSKNVVRRFH